jgi:hypothetical protein
MIQQPSSRATRLRARACAASLAGLLSAWPAHASFMSGDTLAKAADVVAWVVIIVVPIVVVTVFWLVHILPEKIAHKNRHPQTKAIQVLCLLSLVFGGMLWPLAWLWAYTKPVLYKMAYGTDQLAAHGDEPAAAAPGPAADFTGDVARLRMELERVMAQGGAPAELGAIRDQLAALEPRLAAKSGEAR